MSSKQIMLTFDLEEFDLPGEYGQNLPFKEQIRISAEGLRRLSGLLDRHQIRATFFVTGCFAYACPAMVKELSGKHEIASHAYFHSNFGEEYLLRSKLLLRDISGQEIRGLRMPQLRQPDLLQMQAAGYQYDSSINPTWIPGRYNHSGRPRQPEIIKGTSIWEFPVSVSTALRIPLFWLSFKNIHPAIYNALCLAALRHDDYLHLYFHPWEFAEIGSLGIPRWICEPQGERYCRRFDNFLTFLTGQGRFVTAWEFLSERMRSGN